MGGFPSGEGDCRILVRAYLKPQAKREFSPIVSNQRFVILTSENVAIGVRLSAQHGASSAAYGVIGSLYAVQRMGLT